MMQFFFEKSNYQQNELIYIAIWWLILVTWVFLEGSWLIDVIWFKGHGLISPGQSWMTFQKIMLVKFKRLICGATWWPIIVMLVPQESSWLVDENRAKKHGEKCSRSKVVELDMKVEEFVFSKKKVAYFSKGSWPLTCWFGVMGH